MPKEGKAVKKITYYNLKGEIVKEVPLNEKTVKDCQGMKIKCILADGSECIGFANPFYSFEKGDIVVRVDAHSLKYITLESFINLDENTHTFIGEEDHKYDLHREAVPIYLISHIDAILYSGLRWGGIPTNKFNLETQS